MKKLSLALALILVLTCAVFAACGDDTADTSSTAASSSAESKAESSVAESSEAEEESSEAEEESSEVVVPAEITGSNIASTATYTISQLYQQGDASTDWGWDENAPISYPDTDGVEMIDGLFATSTDFSDAAWIGFHGKCPDYETSGYHTITLDLGAVKDITGAKVYVGTVDLGGGINAPSSVELRVSEDGENWTTVNTVTPANVSTTAENCTEVVELPAAASTQYVQIAIVSGAAWAFVSEVEVYSDAE